MGQGFSNLPVPVQIFIPCFAILFVVSLICGIVQSCMHPYGRYGYGHPGMMMGGMGGMGMGGPMIAPSVSMTYTTMPMQPGYAPMAGGVVQQQQQMPPQQSTATSESSSQAAVGGYPRQTV